MIWETAAGMALLLRDALEARSLARDLEAW